ncbi:coiled-coil domain-containing protein 38-like isoform X1 [Perca fluviatilis]|uniref:coiled-coil domain-containing protein 38-like isoform X1 n=1 Tax=Perca fluviatilis TaxID=8168 RepID=UPI0019623381|nr:coiled-coil domain-containing protein 38-like isoform X1 [Perca fluviatilis]XP_039657014.1 coiled-coil domain-containing protein 38-like isoform X1 [Perca fluviatilis]XP_039657022.1 coiled-coil domain-containing protein 38-like isoform X1 [Perca fluviatilis]
MEKGTIQVKVPGSNSRSTERRKKELRTLLAMCVEDETEPKNNLALPKQKQDSPDQNMSLMKEEMKRDRQCDIERKRAQLEASLMKSRKEIKKLKKTIITKTAHMKQLEQSLGIENKISEQCLRRIEKKAEDARTLFEKENQKRKEANSTTAKLTEDIGTLKSELAKIEDILNKYKRYKNILFKLSPPEWQQGSGSSPGPVVPSSREPTLSSARDDTLSKSLTVSVLQEKLELYFSDPQQLLDLMAELTEQNLCLIPHSTRVDETLQELKQTIDATWKKMKKDDERLTLQVNDMEERIRNEMERATLLKKKVQLHDSLKTQDQDILLDALGAKVTEVHCRCVDSRLTNLSTLEKLSSVEYRMTVVLELIENIPEEELETLRMIKDNERKSRQREEQLRLEMERKIEMMKKCFKKSHGESKKITGRRLMPRCIPLGQKVKVSDEDNVPNEEELHAFLFTAEDS